MKSFATRALSAFLAIALFIGLYVYTGTLGLKIANSLLVILASVELLKILFKPNDSKLNRSAFLVFMISIFLVSTNLPQYGAVIFSFFSIAFCLVSLLTQKKFQDLTALTSFQAKSIMGFLYLGLLPAFAVGIFDLPNGEYWYLALLAIVFCGDVGAYLTGMSIGKTKLMPLISPKKTREGALGGLAASVLAGLAMGQLLNHVPLFYMLLLSVLAAIAGQFGDLFESQLKRVAAVKDSGSIMPGHGGVLDRIDGILFAAPIVYFFALTIEVGF